MTDPLEDLDLSGWKCLGSTSVDVDDGGFATIIELEKDGQRMNLRIQMVGLSISASIEDPDENVIRR